MCEYIYTIYAFVLSIVNLFIYPSVTKVMREVVNVKITEDVHVYFCETY